MTVNKKLIAFSVACALGWLCAAPAWASASAPPGWPSDTMAMGSVINGGAEAATLAQRPVYSFFTYAGIDGGGDRGKFIPVDSKVTNIMKQIRDLEGKMQAPTMPTFVFYTIDGSSGVDKIKRDLEPANLVIHYKNLFSLLKQLEGYRDAKHPVPATLVLNPDFIGELHKQCGQYYCPIPFDTQIQVKDSLQTAIRELGLPLTLPKALLGDQQGFPEYVQSINWIMVQAGTNITYGWQDNVWAGDPRGHDWVHLAKSNQTLIDQHVADEVAFVERMKVYSDDPAIRRPDFIAFDKWERDVFTAGVDAINGGYMYNGQDMDVYLKYVKGMAQSLGDQPVMLWQIPGGHLQVPGDIDPRNDHASAEADYILGNPSLKLLYISTTKPRISNLKPYIAKQKVPARYASPNTATVEEYMADCPEWDSACLQTDHLQAVKDANVFSILWGGGSTTGVAGLSAATDDNGWLFGRIKAHGLNNGEGCKDDCDKPIDPVDPVDPVDPPTPAECDSGMGPSGNVKWCATMDHYAKFSKVDLEGSGYEAQWYANKGEKPGGSDTWKKISGPDQPGDLIWSPNKNYPTTGTVVELDGAQYRNKWYANKGQKPGDDPVWEQIGGQADHIWSAKKTYATKDTLVILDGVEYRNQWYANPGDKPGVNPVWQRVN